MYHSFESSTIHIDSDHIASGPFQKRFALVEKRRRQANKSLTPVQFLDKQYHHYIQNNDYTTD